MRGRPTSRGSSISYKRPSFQRRGFLSSIRDRYESGVESVKHGIHDIQVQEKKKSFQRDINKLEDEKGKHQVRINQINKTENKLRKFIKETK